jgi:hypothetical protein
MLVVAAGILIVIRSESSSGTNPSYKDGYKAAQQVIDVRAPGDRLPPVLLAPPAAVCAEAAEVHFPPAHDDQAQWKAGCEAAFAKAKQQAGPPYNSN